MLGARFRARAQSSRSKFSTTLSTIPHHKPRGLQKQNHSATTAGASTTSVLCTPDRPSRAPPSSYQRLQHPHPSFSATAMGPANSKIILTGVAVLSASRCMSTVTASSAATSSSTGRIGKGGRAWAMTDGMDKRKMSTHAGPLTVENINPSVVAASYAVRGPVLDRAMALQAQLKTDPDAVPFDEIIQCNIGNPQSLGQLPLSFHRRVLSLTMVPELVDEMAEVVGTFKQDVVARAKKYIASVPSMGAYTHSQGITAVREEVAKFIEERDGAGSTVDPDNIFLTNGASEGVRLVMTTVLRKAPVFNDGVLVPIPQYPLYSATCTLLDGALVPYYLDESNGWGLDAEELKRQLATAKADGIAVRGLAVINPGNPTGQTLSEENMKAIVQLCVDEDLVLMADEVYQENIWKSELPFTSFRKVATDMGYSAEYNQGQKGLALVSFHSISKGFIGECGIRGGYFELFGIDPQVKAQIYKLASISLCSNTPGQVMTGLMVQPPKLGDPSFEEYEAERVSVLSSLKRRAEIVAKALDSLEGVSCRMSDGALYAFPSIVLPPKFIAESEPDMPADEAYCLKLLESTGVVVVPGSGFGQVDGTYHFRTTFLPPEEKLAGVMERVRAFHVNFIDQYR